MSEESGASPYERYLEYCERGELAYQHCVDDGNAVFFPRLLSPGSGSALLTWRVSKGRGVVYATTVVHRRDQPPCNVALIDIDEGFRMMSRVEDIAPDAVRIGMRVRVRMHPADDKTPAYPVFVLDDNAP